MQVENTTRVIPPGGQTVPLLGTWRDHGIVADEPSDVPYVPYVPQGGQSSGHIGYVGHIADGAIRSIGGVRSGGAGHGFLSRAWIRAAMQCLQLQEQSRTADCLGNRLCSPRYIPISGPCSPCHNALDEDESYAHAVREMNPRQMHGRRYTWTMSKGSSSDD